jgi:molybdopterin-containing oxidoreductase family iron-sulfur binding subunit
LKVLGLGGAGGALAGCDLPTTVTLEEGKEDVVSYLAPEEYVIPGIGVWYASTCTQCAAGCAIHGRVREGRVLKLEGNPNAALNHGKLCMMGQAGLQGHYNPDRVTQPLLRQNGALTPVSWDQALAAVNEKLTGIGSGRFAWFTGTVSGHQLALLDNHLEAMDSGKHYVHEVVNNAVVRTVNRRMFGEDNPRLRLDKAKMILSFGADFLGAGLSPVHDAGQYAKFRTSNGRGLLVQVESKMSLTGGSADLWLAVKPGTEGVLALGIANLLLNKIKLSDAGIPAVVRAQIDQHDVTTVAKITGIAGDRIQRVAALLAERSPSLVLAGPAVEGQAHGYAATAAVLMLNHILGNVGKTIESAGAFPFPQLQARQGNTADLLAFTRDAGEGKLDAVIFHGANPAYSATRALKFNEALAKVGFKISLAQFMDETTAQADVVLPLASYLEDWGSHVPAQQADSVAIHMQQPLMEKIHPETRGLGDILLALLKHKRGAQYEQFPDYYAYLRNAFAAMPAVVKGGAASDDAFWMATLQGGVVGVAPKPANLKSSVLAFQLPAAADAADGALTLVPSPRLGLYDGRHANLPWLQEAPDQISKVVWDSWAELHPDTAAKLGVKNGDLIRVKARHGTLELRAVLLKGMHKEAIAIPLGQGHEAYGRYAQGLGVNPLGIIDDTVESTTGELAMYATRVTVERLSAAERLGIVRLGGADSQMGRKLVATIPVEQLRRTEGV